MFVQALKSPMFANLTMLLPSKSWKAFWARVQKSGVLTSTNSTTMVSFPKDALILRMVKLQKVTSSPLSSAITVLKNNTQDTARSS